MIPGAGLGDSREGARATARNRPAQAPPVSRVGYVFFPAAPPRLSERGFSDTVTSSTGLDLSSDLLGALYNPFAAVPSLHFGYALIVGVVLAVVAERRAVRIAGALYPAVMLLIIVATGVLAAAGAPAQAEDFYRGKTITLLVGSAEGGGYDQYARLLARHMGRYIAGGPAIVRCTGALGVADGTVVGVDGARGELTVGVDEDGVRDLRERDRIRAARLARSQGPGRTADGHPVALLANVGSARDLEGLAADAVEGVGLFRNELLYLDRPFQPSA